MEIIKVTTTKQAEASSEHAMYEIEFSIINNVLARVYASIYHLEPDEHGNKIYIGNISSENNIINCSIPASQVLSHYFEDFEQYVKEMINDNQDE